MDRENDGRIPNMSDLAPTERCAEPSSHYNNLVDPERPAEGGLPIVTAPPSRSLSSTVQKELIELWYVGNPDQLKYRHSRARWASKAIKIASDRRRREDGAKSWRHLNPEVQHLRRLEVMKEEGPCQAVTLLISKEIGERAETQDKPLEWLVDRIRFHVRSVLKRKVDWLLFDHRNDADRLHLHGLLAIADNEIPLVKGALQKALGVCGWSKSPQFQFKQDPSRNIPDRGWLSYCLDGQDSRSCGYSSSRRLTQKARELQRSKRSAS